MTRVETYDPRTGKLADAGFDDTGPDEVAGTCATAAEAAEQLADLAAWPRPRRAAMLREIAERIDYGAADLAALADEETALGQPRLTGEVARTTGQLRLFAAAVEEGSFLEVVIDHADPDAKPAPRPDLRRMLHPIGAVGVF